MPRFKSSARAKLLVACAVLAAFPAHANSSRGAASSAVSQPTLVSVNQAGNASGNGTSDLTELSLSADGRYLAFASQAPDLVTGDGNGTFDVFLRDLRAGTTTLVSVNAAGTGSGNGASGVFGAGTKTLAISADGSLVAFTSAASDLTANDTNGRDDVFVRDLKSAQTTLVSVNAAGTASGNGVSLFPFISADGSVVSFRSTASDLAANDTNGLTDVFARCLKTGVTSLVSVNAAGTASGSGGGSGASTLSDDGRYVAFESRAGNLVSNDSNGSFFSDIFVRDLQTGVTTLVSASADGAASADDETQAPIISAGGTHVVFSSRATNLVSLGDENVEYDVFVRDLKAGKTSLVSVNRDGTAAGADFSVLVSYPAVSADGNIVAFLSRAPDLVSNDSNGFEDVFVRDLARRSTTLVSVNKAGTASANGPAGVNAIGLSADGRFVSFESIATDMVDNDGDTVHDGTTQDVFVRDLQTSKTTLVSVGTSGVSGNRSSLRPFISRDGTTVGFKSEASDLTANDNDTQEDVFAFELPGQLGFSADAFAVGEGGGAATVTVTRTGDASAPASVDYATGGGTASERQDYTTALGTLRFAAGEASKTFKVLITDDSYVEGAETLGLILSNPSGAAFVGGLSRAVLTINDNDAAPSPNPIGGSEFFVRQHYADFLNREPDAGGLAFWTGGIESCGADQQCRANKRIDTSAAFFLSIEFQETGFLVHRVYKTAFGESDGTARINSVPTPIKVPVVRLHEFLPDTQRLGRDVIVGTAGWPERLAANKAAFALEFVQRARFMARYPSDMTPAAFVDALIVNAGITIEAGERDALVNELSGNNTAAGRASVLRQVAENEELADIETNKAFVLMQYFGYLRRNPNDAPDTDHSGYNFWLTKLNQFGGDFRQAQMVFAFIDSIEYKQRFGNP
jgi:Calx-beta domain/WD40-like Beta Propeller Repeat